MSVTLPYLRVVAIERGAFGSPPTGVDQLEDSTEDRNKISYVFLIPIQLDNHGNHLVVMEADDSAINVPAIAAAHVIKRYIAQAPDEITLEVGEFVSVIDMPPAEETIWWRGKKGFEV